MTFTTTDAELDAWRAAAAAAHEMAERLPPIAPERVWQLKARSQEIVEHATALCYAEDEFYRGYHASEALRQICRVAVDLGLEITAREPDAAA